VNKLSSLGRRLSRASFLCLGGAAILIATGGLLGNLSEILHVSDWQDSGASDVIRVVTIFAIGGGVFLAVAFSLYKDKSWATPFAALTSLAALIWVVAAGWGTPGFIGFAAPIGVPMAIALIWSLSQMTSKLRYRGMVSE
jgi:hypothetical protein